MREAAPISTSHIIRSVGSSKKAFFSQSRLFQTLPIKFARPICMTNASLRRWRVKVAVSVILENQTSIFSNTNYEVHNERSLVPEDATICSSDPTAAVSAQRSFTASWRPVYAACGIGKFMRAPDYANRRGLAPVFPRFAADSFGIV